MSYSHPLVRTVIVIPTEVEESLTLRFRFAHSLKIIKRCLGFARHDK
jgi:hypothetical protein